MNNPVSTTNSISVAIAQTLERLRALSQVSVQDGWRYFDGDLAIVDATNPDNWQEWTLGEVNAKDHHSWVKGRVVRWFSRTIAVPHHLHGFPLVGLCLRLALLWWSEETQVYVNGLLVQEGDLFDCAPRLLLSESVKGGDQFAIALRMVSPIHDDGALMKSVCHYEVLSPDALPEPSFIANELAVLHTFLEKFQPEKLEILSHAIAEIDWDALRSNDHSPLRALRQTFLPLAEPIKQRTIKLLGHAHLDMAWLWTVEKTWKAAERTFHSVLALQKDFPELTFAHTTPALYEWIEHNRPDLFAQIREQVKAGKWEIVAGFWIEPELNLISGESIVRQVLYGQRYIQQKFGQTCAIAWVPDTFGFTWQLPQILKQGGVDYFVTQKLRWGDTTKFPHELFLWQAPDGTQILSLMSAPIGEFIDPVKMATFAWELEQSTGLQMSLWLPGVGDHGGGPTRDMLEVARRWQQSPFFPQLEWGTALEYLEGVGARETEDTVRGRRGDAEITNTQHSALTTQTPQSSVLSPQSSNPTPHSPLSTPLPIWNSELYLEFHRGCYTTHADQKRANRRSEQLLYEAELWASLATIATGATYPKSELETAWKKTLFNQFHDILPGSSIPGVFVEANQEWAEVGRICSEIIDRSLNAIATQIKLPEPPHPEASAFVVFNDLNWQRSHLVTLFVDAEESINWQIYSFEGQELETQCQFTPHREQPYCLVSFLAEDIPGVGYCCFWLCPCQPKSSIKAEREVEPNILENEFLRVEIDSTGEFSRIFDKVNHREVLSAVSNQLQAFEDKGQYWDAWNIDPNYAEHPLPPAELLFLGKGSRSLETSISIERRIGQSIFYQFYRLQKRSPILEVQTHVDWQERHVLVKTAFPLNLEADFATYEIPCGAIQRTTKPQTEAEKAQWEVPAMRWADLTEGRRMKDEGRTEGRGMKDEGGEERDNTQHSALGAQHSSTPHSPLPTPQTYGVSLLNDCKYGYDAQPNQLRLTLLRGSEWPDPEADKGQHTFTYAIYPHAGDWKQAQTVRRGYELNMPLHVVQLDSSEMSQAGTLPPVGSLLDLGSENLVLMAFKQAEDSSDEWILRCYECHGEEAQLDFSSDLNLKLKHSVDLLEQPTTDTQNEGQTIPVRPWQIASFSVRPPSS